VGEKVYESAEYHYNGFVAAVFEFDRCDYPARDSRRGLAGLRA
jgi:hypothetical protein